MFLHCLAGDSGGPLLLMDAPYGQLEDGKPQLDMIVGITSFGYAGDDADACSGDEPAVYTRVDYFLDWIERTITCHQDVRSEIHPSSSAHARSVRAAFRRARPSWRRGGSTMPCSRNRIWSK